MPLAVPNAAEVDFLELILGQNYDLRLFTNSVTASETLTAGDFTEATFTGYTANALTGGAWTITAGNPATGAYAAQAFVATADQAPQTVRGYYVTHASSGELRWFEIDGGGVATPLTVQYTGEAIRVAPQFTLADTSD